MSRLSAALFSLCLLQSVSDIHAQSVRTPKEFPLRVRSVEVVGREAALGVPLAGDVGPDGSVYVLDYLNASVLRFSPEGKLVWQVGRKGRGPGEFQMPYRLAVRGDGRVLVYNLGTNEITLLTPEGRYVDRLRLPFHLTTVDNLVALPGGQVAFSGFVHSLEQARRFGVHVFDSELRHQHSFGPLPVARNPAVLR